MTTLADLGMFRGPRSHVRAWWLGCPGCKAVARTEWRGESLVCLGCGWTGGGPELFKLREDAAAGRYRG